MTCPRCGTEMIVDIELDIDGKVTIYYCPNCGEMAHKG